MSTFDTVQNIICEVLEIEQDEVRLDTYIMRDLPTESIDLMEYGVGITKDCGITVQDEAIFLKSLRLQIATADDNGRDAPTHLSNIYPHLAPQRILEILETISEGPVLQLRDIVAYVEYAKHKKD